MRQKIQYVKEALIKLSSVAFHAPLWYSDLSEIGRGRGPFYGRPWQRTCQSFLAHSFSRKHDCVDFVSSPCYHMTNKRGLFLPLFIDQDLWRNRLHRRRLTLSSPGFITRIRCGETSLGSLPSAALTPVFGRGVAARGGIFLHTPDHGVIVD